MEKGPFARQQRRIVAEFYRTEAGREPVREWLKGLAKDERQAIAKDIRKAEYGWPLGMPTCDSLGVGLWEVRTSLETRIARVFFFMAGRRMVLLHGIIKKTQRAPAGDLETARERKRNAEVRLRRLARRRQE